MSGIATKSLRITGTQLAQHFRFRCERKLRYELEPGGEGVPVPQHRPGLGLLTMAGRRFERKKLASLVRRFGADAVLCAGTDARGDALRLGPERVVEALRDPGPVQFLVQPRLVLPDPDAFARRYGIDPERLEIAPAQPDLVRIRRGKDGRPRFEVIDVKWSRERAVHHYAQIAFYVLVLEEIARAEGIDGVVEARRGWIWTRGRGGPRPFALAAYRHHVEEFLRAELPRIAALEPPRAAWHLHPACGGCPFFAHCRAEADRTDDLSRVAGLTPVARQVLHGRGITTVAALTRAGLRRDTYTGCHALEAGESALRQRAQALSYRKVFDVEKQTHLLGEGERVRLYVSAEGDPVSGIVFALGLRAQSSAGARAAGEVFVAKSGTVEAEREMLNAFLARASQAVRGMLAADRSDAGRGPKALHAYVYDRAELEQLRGMLHRHLSAPDAQPGIAELARLLFPSSAKTGLRAAAAAPGTVLLDAVAELFALPVPYSWDLAAVSAALQPAEQPRVHQPRDGYAWPMSSQVAFERAHQVWRGRRRRTAEGIEEPGEVRAEIVRTVESKLAALDSVLRAVREQAARARNPRLRMEPPVHAVSMDGAEAIADPVLETLRIFTELEAAEEALSIRALHALPSRDRARRFECIRGMSWIETRGDGSMVFEFDPECRDVKFRPGDFSLVLTNDDGRTLQETDRKPWLRRRLMMELIDFDLAGPRPRVVLAPDGGFAKALEDRQLSLAHECVLDRAEADFNTRRVVASLRALADGCGEAAFVRGLLDGRVPDGWLRPLDADAAWEATVGRVARAVLNAEQEAAWRAVFERTVSVVWGPPGTGKTYLLAWILLGLAAAAKAGRRSLRILVTAATHRAIVNVLVRLARELEAAGIAPPLRAVKLRSRGSAADEELEGLDVELVEDETLPKLFDECDGVGMPLVVGSTVWSLWKRMRDAASASSAPEEDDGAGEIPVKPMFDVVVIDEASQMKVADALVALSSIRRGGRVILCGDDRQLSPVIRGSYDRDQTLFGSAFAHFAARFGRMALRESRRMNRALVAYPRHVFYPGLESKVPEQRLSVLPPSDLDLSDPLDALLWEVFFRPDDAVVFCTYDGYRATARNAFEAGLVARLASLARAGLADPATGGRYTPERFRSHAFAAISPHRAQNSAILGELLGRGWAHGELPVVDTVERMQGNEREMIVVSYAVADREYAEAEAEFLLNPNRFNVSITRPRSKLVVLMSDEVLRTLPRDERVMTESMAVKGYLRHAGRRVREVGLPSPDGGTVRVVCRFRSLV
jgi:DNA replication ATP-dependent helicase Dna2